MNSLLYWFSGLSFLCWIVGLYVKRTDDMIETPFLYLLDAFAILLAVCAILALSTIDD